MVAQSQFDVGCTLVIWGDFKGIIHFLYMFVMSDTITVDSFTLDPSNQHNKAFSTDIAPSSAHLDLLPSELATPRTNRKIHQFTERCSHLFFSAFMLVMTARRRGAASWK